MGEVSPFSLLFWVLCGLCALAQYFQISESFSKSAGTTSEYKKQQRVYLLAYLTAITADWLQGPYIYALYQHYNFSKRDIGILFIAGYGSSMLFGTFTGSLADRYGRKKMCLSYCLLYTISCATKHSSSFSWLMFGRITGGVATSILFSCFESWLVGNHNTHYFPSEWLQQTLAIATVGNGFMAIASGWMGGFVRDQFNSFVAPFDLAICFVVVSALIIALQWVENRGDSAATLNPTKADNRSKFQLAYKAFVEDPKILLIGLVQSLFEGSMYIFVFMWTPKLEPLYSNLPHGKVFGCFMACMMLGSSSLKYFNMLRPKPVTALRDIFLLASVCLAVPSFRNVTGPVVVTCFCVFEGLVGLYWPSIAFVKSKYVPEEIRATVYNVFRIPLNLIVIVVLMNLETLSDDFVFAICGFLLLTAAIFQQIFQCLIVASMET